MQNPYLPGQDEAAPPQALRRRVVLHEQPPVLVSFGTGFPHKIRFRKRVRQSIFGVGQGVLDSCILAALYQSRSRAVLTSVFVSETAARSLCNPAAICR